MKINILIITLSILILVSCKKDATFPSAPEIPVPGNYFPTTLNSSWTYVSNTAPDTITYTVQDETTVNVIGNKIDSVSENKIYKNFNLTYYHSTFKFPYIRQENSKYYRLLAIYAYYEYLFLKGDVAAGTSWVEFHFNSLEKTTYTILEININMTVGDKFFKNVIHVKEKNEQTNHNNEIRYTDNYYAKDIGLIYSIVKTEGLYPSGSEMKLIKYNIK